MDRVILVDERDHAIGTAEKLDAHRRGLLHRAFSVFVFDAAGRLLLQQRAHEKYHSPGLWSNTCCGHPRPGEATADAAARRLREEMGLHCALEPAGSFTYEARLGELIEHEVDHVFTGVFDGPPQPDAREAAAWCWVDAAELATDLTARPARYTAWLGPALDLARARR